MGKFFVDGQRLGMVRKDVPAKLDHRNFAGDGSIDHESAKDGGAWDDAERRASPGFLRLFSKARLQQKGRKAVNASSSLGKIETKYGAREFIRS
jgi:hypothetical protein